MKSFQLTAIRTLGLHDVPEPRIEAPTDVLVKMGAVGVCGSDIHYYTDGRIGSQIVQFPFTVGHECAGTVVQVGDEVTRVRVGDRVAIEPAVTCGHCDQCRAGRENTCRNNRFLGCPDQAAGCLSEYVVMPQQNCFPISDGIGLAEATISEPLAIGMYAVLQAGLDSDDRIGIFGMGPIGRTVLIPALREHNVNSAYCTDIIDQRCKAAEQAGATWVGNPRQVDIVQAIFAQEPQGLDVVFECCGEQEAIDQAIQLLRPGGKLLLIGIPTVDRISFAPESLRRQEISIVNIRRQRDCVQPALNLIDRHPADATSLITHRFPFAETDRAFEMVAGYQDGVVKAIVDFE